MHSSSLQNMRRFVERHLADRGDERLVIADIGSQDVNGSYQPLFDRPDWRYVGVDMAAGKNVDIVLSDVYRWSELEDAAFDVVVSGQALEHIEYFWLTMLEIARIMRPGGLCCLIAPSAGFEHRYPVDCWRFYPDGMKALARYAGLEVVDAYAEWDRERYPTMDATWQDCVLVARKPDAAGAGGDAHVHSHRLPEVPSAAPAMGGLGAPAATDAPHAEMTYVLTPLQDPPNDARVERWHLDSPRSGVPAEVLDGGRFMLRGWVLGASGGRMHVAIRSNGAVRSYPLNTRRPDVIEAILEEDPAGHARLYCGFELPMAPMDSFELGFECEGGFSWIHRADRS